MAVGVLTSMKCHASINPAQVTITFTKPANCTAVKFIMSPTDLAGSALTRTYQIPLPFITGATVTYTFTGLSAGKKYYLTGTPYNGTTAGTVTTYSNSNSKPINSIAMPVATVTPLTSYGFPVLTATTSSSGSTSPATNKSNASVSPKGSTGTVTNNGSSSVSPSAGGNTPNPNSSTLTAGTTSAKPSDYGSDLRESKTITGLQPNQTYQIKIRAAIVKADGTIIHSAWSTGLIVNTPATSPSGSNFPNTNLTSDQTLAGGSLNASSDTDPLQGNTGQLDLNITSPDGTGVIINQSGIGGYLAGTKKFLISATTGDAYFAGRVEAGDIYIPTAASPTFSVNAAGYITSTSGKIANWEISTNTLKSSNNYITLDSSQSLISLIGSGGESKGVYLTASGGTNSSPRIYIGTGNFGTAGTGFYADGQGYFSLSNQLTFTPSSGGITSKVISATTSNGSAVLGLSSVDSFIKIGMGVTGTNIASGSYVTVVNGTSITMNFNAVGNGSQNITFYQDSYSELSVTGKIRGVIESTKAILSPRLSTQITSATLLNNIVTFTTSGHAYLAAEKVSIEGMPSTNGFNNLNRSFTIKDVIDSVTFTVDATGVTGLTTGTVSAITNTYAFLQEVTMGLHPQEGISTDSYYHASASGLRQDRYNWWFTNNQFRVGNALTYMKYSGDALIIKGGSDKFISLNVGGSNAQNKIGITSNVVSGLVLPVYNSANTPVYMDGAGQFSLGTQLVFNGTSLTIGGYTPAQLAYTPDLSNYITTNTEIGAGYIVTGVLASGTFYNANTSYIKRSTTYSEIPHGAAFSTSGTAINLDDGTITSKNFRIDASGNAAFSGSITASSFSTDASLSTAITNGGVQRMIISPITVTSNWESAETAMRLTLDPGYTTFMNTPGFLEVVGRTNGSVGVNLLAPYLSTNKTGAAGFALKSSASGIGAIFAYGRIYTTSTASGTLGVKQISAQSGGSASGGSDGDVVLIY